MATSSRFRGPPLSRHYDSRATAYDDQSRHAGMVYVLMLVVALAFGGFLWQLYSEPSVPRVTTPAAPERPVARPTVPLNPPAAPIVGEPVTAESSETRETTTVPRVAAEGPLLAPNGPYVAQLAALQSEAGVDAAWRRMAARAPQLFSQAQLDVERADLGPRGVYHRVRAGYFTDRDSAASFCERVRETGQDCIVAAR